MKTKYYVFVFTLLALVSCQNDLVPPPEIEVFTGELEVVDIKLSPPWTYHYTDKVVFTVEGGTYKIEHVTHHSNLCSSGGQVFGFGTNRVRLTPTFHDYSQSCDSLKVPQGEFKSVFRRDSLYLGPGIQVFHSFDSVAMKEFIDTMIYHFWLTQ